MTLQYCFPLKHVLLRQQLFRQWDLNSLEWSGWKAYVWKCGGIVIVQSLLAPDCAGNVLEGVTFWMSFFCWFVARSKSNARFAYPH